MIDLCLPTDVSSMIDTVGRYTSTSIASEIVEQTEYIYMEYGNPLAAIISVVDKDENNNYYKQFFTGERPIYRADRVFIGTATKIELTSTTDFTTSTTNGQIKLTSGTTVGGQNIDNSDEVIVWYVPRSRRKLCAIRSAEKLLEKSDTTSGADVSKELTVIRQRRMEYEDFIKNQISIQLASQYAHYDEIYDTNELRVVQQFKKNRYLW